MLDIFDRTLYGEWADKSGDKFTQISNLLFIALSTALFINGFPRFSTIRRGSLVLFLLAGLLLCSTLWSVSPALSFRQNILYFSGIMAAIGIVENCDGDDIMDLFARLCFLAAAASLFLMVVAPSMVVVPSMETTGGGDDFRGIFSQKNSLGAAMTMGALATLHRLRSQKQRKLSSIVFLITIAAAAYKSASSTSCLVILIFIITDYLLRLIQKGGQSRTFGILGISTGSVFLIVAILSWNSVLGLLGKDATLTGRTDLWALVIPHIYQRLFFGWGYMAFWSSDNPIALEISDTLGWRVPQAHNGILEIMLSVGLFGALCFVLVWLRNLRLAFRCMRESDKNMGSSCALSWIGILVVGMTEVVLIYPGPSTMMFCLTGLFCERADYAYRRRRMQEAKSGLRTLVPSVDRYPVASTSRRSRHLIQDARRPGAP
jgi:O-antigen ligase